jgi:Zn-dependent peptidase ImmA (M78 family)/DNA-binding XRE family transcriptional regulator
MNPSDVNPQMVTLARQSRGLTQTELADRIAASQASISKIEAGVAQVSSKELERLATALGYPPHFFTKHERIYGPGIDELYHRKRQKVSAATLHKVYANAAIRQMNVEVLLRSWDTMEDDFPSFPIDEFDANPEKIARTLRALWQLPPGPIYSMTKVIEDAGGLIIPCDFETRHIDGFSRHSANMPPLFYLNRNLLPDRWRWTLAHELGHVVMHSASEPHEQMEREANLFAGEFLTPTQEIKPQLLNLSFHKLAGLKRHWKVAMQALLMRAHHLGLITDRRRRHMFMQLSKAGYRLREPPELDPPAEPPELLPKIVKWHREQLDYSDADLCDALAINDSDLQYWYPSGKPHLRIVN